MAQSDAAQSREQPEAVISSPTTPHSSFSAALGCLTLLAMLGGGIAIVKYAMSSGSAPAVSHSPPAVTAPTPATKPAISPPASSPLAEPMQSSPATKTVAVVTPPKPDEKRERAASSRLRLARQFLDDRKTETGKKWLSEIAKEFPETESGKTAKKLLDERN